MMPLRTFVLALLFAFSRAQSDTLENATSTTTTTLPTTTTTTKVTTSTTTPSPPEPEPKVEPTWTVKSASTTCLLVRGNFTFSVTYTSPAGNSVSDKVDIPPTAKASGSCGPFINSLVLAWNKSNLTFMFIKKPIYNAGVDTGEGSYSLTTIFGRLTVENPNDDGNRSSSNVPTRDSSSSSPSSGGQSFYITVREPDYMTTPLHNSYSCESYQSLAADKTGSVYLEMKGIQVEAFHNGTDSTFSPSIPCTKDTMSSVMSIVGYAVLAGLVAAVAGYLAWKKFGRGGYTEV